MAIIAFVLWCSSCMKLAAQEREKLKPAYHYKNCIGKEKNESAYFYINNILKNNKQIKKMCEDFSSDGRKQEFKTTQ